MSTYDDRRQHAELRACEGCGAAFYFVHDERRCRACRGVSQAAPRCELCGKRVPENRKLSDGTPRRFCSHNCSTRAGERRRKGITSPYKPTRR